MKSSKVYAYSVFVFIFLAFATLSSYAYSPVPYTMKDLEILAEEKSHIEFFDHALDLKPVERNGHWREMVYNASESFLKEAIEAGRFSPQIFGYVEKLALWPTLRNNEIFQVRRAKYGVKYFRNCLENEKKRSTSKFSPCFNKIKMFWRNTPKDFINLKLGIDLAKLTSEFLTNEDLWPFYSPITLHKYAGETCKNSDLINLFLARITSNHLFATNLEKLQEVINKNCSTSCWDHMLPQIKLTLMNAIDSEDGPKFLSLLFAMNSLTQAEKDFFLVKYVLDGPQKGPLFNLAWSTIKELGNDFNRRKQVIDNLKMQTALPGKLFQTKDKKRLRIILGFFNKNIPEYMNLYTGTCISYLRGKIKVNSGNPTPGCHDLFRSPLSSLFLTPQTKQAYKESL